MFETLRRFRKDFSSRQGPAPPKPTAYKDRLSFESALLRLVQAGVASGAESINFSQTNREIGVEFFGGHKWLTSEVESALRSEGKSFHLASLASSLQHLQSDRTFAFTLELQGGTSLAWDGRELHRIESKKRFRPHSSTLFVC